MGGKHSGPGRAGFTLIELLVVMTIIALLAALGYLMLPSLFSDYGRVRSVDQLSQWLLTAKQRAKRDGLPTGLRLLLPADDNGNVVVNPDGTASVRQVQYVQQPEPLSGGSLILNTRTTPPSFTWSGGALVTITAGRATFQNVDFTLGSANPEEWLVQPGDSLELQDQLHLIGQVLGPNRLALQDLNVNFNNPTQPGRVTGNYRILRRPRPLQGESVLTIPNNVAVDMGQATITSGVVTGFASGPSRNVPERRVSATSNVILEVVFGPGGGLVGSGVGSGKVLLWVRDGSAEPPDGGHPILVAIQARTGFIAAHPVAPGANPYAFTEDARASGM
jgi:prepilin-type N-terminal cleavage/methylation domain-containing protein